ncbi:hypothetical protein [Alteromonas sp. KUL49]|uniref:hypothetical protein n=1 Tax=Alteromonas sp. KUL49 TaxID=2480798 RepID=UPI00102F04E6|nr:hypothetical protein [Alteromonas sp. KUL49]TAP38726.1 hypothetical protein EYS00_15095 [Alteromonas sp. KUL49]GEA12680.1 hypothetical protein KUL49_30550 [Alteromonas sp. KUL49]
MAFKRGSLTNWVVTRTVKLAGESSVTVDIQIFSKKDGEAIVARGSDAETVKGFVKKLTGYQDEKGKELGLDALLADFEAGEFAPAIITAIAMECVGAQHDAAIKN